MVASIVYWSRIVTVQMQCNRYPSCGLNKFHTTLQAIDAKYTEVAARLGPDQEVIFEEEKITLDIPEEGIVLDSGWSITPHTHPGVSLLLH